jgi:CheY-like chemotaxis protein
MPNLRALIVDDSEGMRHYLGAILQECGFECLRAADGIEALRLAVPCSIDLVITDLEMPRMDGFELIALVNRGLLGLPPPPIIVCSSRLRDQHVLQRPELKTCAARFDKPVFPADLVAALNKIFPLAAPM